MLRLAIEQKWGALEADHDSDSAPARSYRIKGGLGRIGFISSVSQPFCAACDRLRLGANGFLKLCMAQADGIDLKAALRGGDTDQQLAARIAAAAWNKPQGHDFYTQPVVAGGMMSRMGG
jgi:cyclic pyranopterin phosphate synthase